jgi:hypothetical protein
MPGNVLRSFAWLAALCTAIGLPGAPASAHRVAEALSVIEFNPRTGAIEIVHTLNLHDLDHVFSKRLGKAVTVGGDRESLDAVAAHIGEAFALAAPGGAPIPLELAGMEISGGDLVAYYEAPRPDDLEGVTVFNTLLMPGLPGQINQVNVELPSGVKTLFFDGGTEAKPVLFRE